MPWKYTDPNGADRFWPRVVISESCRIWTGQLDRHGYGRLRDFEQRWRRAHVYAWWLVTGVWPKPGQVVGHTCDILYPPEDKSNRACVRNDGEGVHVVDGVEYRRLGHLWLGTASANIRDRHLKGRTATGDRSGARTHPESRPRGDQNWTRQRPDLVLRGELNPAAKLSTVQVLEMRALAAQGIPNKELATRFSMSYLTVWEIVTRKTWRHL